MRIELITATGCPNVDATRTALREALAAAGLPAEWIEWDRASPASPQHARSYGSPTVLVDGADVSGEGGAAGADCCRLYRTADGFHGVPSRESIMDALRVDRR